MCSNDKLLNFCIPISLISINKLIILKASKHTYSSRSNQRRKNRRTLEAESSWWLSCEPPISLCNFFRFHITLCNDFMKRRQINPDTTIFRPLWHNYLVECESDNRLIDWRRLLLTCFQICTPASNRRLFCEKSDNFLKDKQKINNNWAEDCSNKQITVSPSQYNIGLGRCFVKRLTHVKSDSV